MIRDNFPSIDGIFCADGTVFLYAIAGVRYVLAAALRPGDPAWTSAHTYLMPNAMERKCAAAYHAGSIMLVIPNRSHIQMVRLHMTGGVGGRNGSLVTEILMIRSYDGPQPVPVPRPRRQSIHVFESRGELLAAFVVLAISPEARDLASVLSVWIYTLEPEPLDGCDHHQRWIRRDGWSMMNDRVLFLGRPTSFAVDAVGGGGGCAYFVLNSRNAGWFGRMVPEASRVYRYSFKDGRTTEVDELPLGAGWKDEAAMMWIAPRPSTMAPANEIRERLLRPPSSKKGAPCPSSIIRHGRTELRPPFKFLVGNLPSWVDSSQLKLFFNKYGHVTDERVIIHTQTGSSYRYGFVTMATFEEPAEVLATLDGAMFYGNVLQVKKQSAKRRPKGPFVMPLLAQNTEA